MLELHNDVEKRLKLFNAYQSQDQLKNKMEQMEERIRNFEETIEKSKKDYTMKIQIISSEFGEKHRQLMSEISGLNDKVK